MVIEEKYPIFAKGIHFLKMREDERGELIKALTHKNVLGCSPKTDDVVDCKNLEDLFVWDRSPQGVRYWTNMYYELGKRPNPVAPKPQEDKPNARGRCILTSTLEKKYPRFFNGDYQKLSKEEQRELRRALHPDANTTLIGDSPHLSDLFNWISSPQGGDYWRDIFNRFNGR